MTVQVIGWGSRAPAPRSLHLVPMQALGSEPAQESVSVCSLPQMNGKDLSRYITGNDTGMTDEREQY